MFPGLDPFSMILLPVIINIATGSVNVGVLLNQLKTKQKPINHDLQKAIKTAYLQALLEIAQEFKSGKIKTFRLYVPTELDRKIKQWQDEIKQIATVGSETAIAPPLENTAELEQLLLSHGESSDQIKGLETRLISQALQGIADLPPDYQDQVQTGLFARVYAHFVEQLKTNDRAYRAFELEYLTMINASLTAIGTGQEQIVLKMQDLFQGLEVTLERLKADVAEILARLDPQKPELTTAEWRVVGQMMFSDRQALTSNLFSSEDGVELKSLEVYVPLGLEERKERQRVQGDRSPEEFSPQQTTLTPISEDEFFMQILQPGQGSIAIIGEPGSGKTTRLQAVGDRIFREHLGLPIWVSLGKLGNQSLGDYLRQWLRDATGYDSLWADFQAQFGSGRVWLLLDGLDEMTTRIDTQQGDLVRGWWSKARLLLTCRGNVWDANRGTLQDFAVYRNLDFTPAQVEDYIQRWFRAAGQEGAGTELHTALQQENNTRLRDLVRHPLRLSLLCCAWHGGERSLPETQAGLYAQFVEQVYKWKATFIKTSPDQRRALQAKLSELSLLAIEGKDAQGKAIPRFWFRESLIKRVFGGLDDPLCELALRVGWLINLGKTAEKPIETAYGFYHATFQEYFAALGVEDWDYFLPRDHESSPVAGKKYRIFEPQWKQVILLWLGREDIVKTESIPETQRKTKELKEEFIQALVEFEDGCNEYNLYKFRSQFLAAWLLQDFKNSVWNNFLINWLIEIGLLGWLNSKTDEWKYSLFINSGIARQILIEINTDLVREKILEVLGKTDAQSIILCNAIWCLGEMYPSSDRIINKLLSFICKSSKDVTKYATNGVHYQAIESLGKIAFKNQETILILKELISSRSDFSTQIRAIKTLAKISPEFVDEASDILLKMLNETNNDEVKCYLAVTLGDVSSTHQEFIINLFSEIAPRHNSIAMTKLTKYIDSIQDTSTPTKNPSSIANQKYYLILNILESLDNIITDSNEKKKIIETLNPFLKSNKFDDGIDIYKSLLDIIERHKSEGLAYFVSHKLQNIIKTQAESLFIVDYISTYLTLDSNTVCAILWECAANLPYPDFYHAWHSTPE